VTKTKLLVSALVIAAGIGVYLAWRLVLQTGELGEKPAWAALQGVEVRYRQRTNADAMPIVLERVDGSNFSVLGLPTSDPTYPRAWLILGPRTPGPAIKLLPEDADFIVSCGFVDELPTRTSVEPAVLEFLREECRP
jgi:hypothetical protein